MVKWYSLFSHTGNETEMLRILLNYDVNFKTAITNNMRYNGVLPVVKLPTAKEINKWLTTPGNVEPGSLITLNGYMRILPTEVINYLHALGCKIWNIHPAPIQLYPELKGADPQERLYTGIKDGKYQYIGVVIHDVTSMVDDGPVLYWTLQLADPSVTKDQLYEDLHDMGTRLWLEAFREEIARG